MARVTIRRYCADCGQMRPFAKDGPAHGLHLVLTILTAGLWLPIWLLAGLASALTPYRCTFCGKGRH